MIGARVSLSRVMPRPFHRRFPGKTVCHSLGSGSSPFTSSGGHSRKVRSDKAYDRSALLGWPLHSPKTSSKASPVIKLPGVHSSMDLMVYPELLSR